MGERIAILHDGEDVIVHATADFCASDYDTLCGMDANDPEAGTEEVIVPRGGRARINCDQCLGVWKTARLYVAKDFAENPK